MSKFFKALEQAERERALRDHARRQEAIPTEPSGGSLASPREDTPPAQVSVAAQPPTIPSEGVEEHLVSLLDPTSFEAEQYRGLRHVVERLHKTADLSVIAVSSSEIADGKTTTAINLAGALAQAQEARVLLVDADLRQSSIGELLGLGGVGSCGLVDAILAPGVALQDVVRDCPPFNLSVLMAGRRPTSPYEVLKSSNLGEILEEARRRYEYIVLDTPPLVPFPDCRVIEKWVDGFLVVVAAHKTPRKHLMEALSLMDQAKIVGLVFNCSDQPFSPYYDASGKSPDGDRTGWWVRALERISGSGRRQRSSRPGRERYRDA